MSLSISQLRKLILKPILQEVDLYSPIAEKLIIGTIAAESIINHTMLIKQIKGPALGIIQMEPATHRWIKDYVSHRSDSLKKVVEWIVSTGNFHEERLVYDLKYACLMCRLRYLVVPKPLPSNDIVEIASYWKEYYNTSHGKGTIEGFISKYERYVGNPDL